MATQRAISLVLFLISFCCLAHSSTAQVPARSAAANAAPVPAGVGQETSPVDEDQDIERLKAIQLAEMIEKARELRQDPKERGQHPKQHGVVVATFTVREGLRDELRVGLFREPGSYTAVIRFSNTRESDDWIPDNHGMAIKVLGVEGEKLLEQEKDATTQDFVLVDDAVFISQNVSSLADFMVVAGELKKELKPRLLTLPADQQGEAFLTILRGKRPREAKVLEARVKRIGSPLLTEYFSTTAYKFGDRAAVKYRAYPERRDYLREAMVERLANRRRPAKFIFSVQRQGDPTAMPIEDPTVEWTSSWEPVATIEIPAQDFDFPALQDWGNKLSFNPWHALKEHQPLGGINRARKVVYLASSELRHKNMSVRVKEPTEAEIPRQVPSDPPASACSEELSGLDHGVKETYYHLPQGNEIYPLDWLKALRTNDHKGRFVDDLERFGLIPDPSDNDGLPVGMAFNSPSDMKVLTGAVALTKKQGSNVESFQGLTGIRMIGITCAGCHVGEITRNGRRFRIDGAPNRFDLNSFYQKLFEATELTLLDSKRFSEFKKALANQEGPKSAESTQLFVLASLAMSNREQIEKLGASKLKELFDKVEKAVDDKSVKPQTTESLGQLLRKELFTQEKDLQSGLDQLTSYLAEIFKGVKPNEIVKLIADASLLKARAEYLMGLTNVHAGSKPPTVPGPGRIDAFVNGRNLIFRGDTIAANSPVNYPHLWQVKQTTWFHWDGNTNSLMERNIGQVVGLGAVYGPRCDSDSLVLTPNLHTLEEITKKIQPPRWPVKFMGTDVDQVKAKNGEAIFKQRCITCHTIPEGPDWKAPDLVFPAVSIKTDAKRADSFAQTLKDGQEFAAVLGKTANCVKKTSYERFGVSPRDQAMMDLPDRDIKWRTTKGYVARPLVAAWATAPYLHNGSVPTLYHLLSPVNQRPKTFPVGHREYDPVKLGYVTDPVQVPEGQRGWMFDFDEKTPGRQDFDTSKEGNGNFGHEGHIFGTDLSEQDRMDLLEYLKGT
jgi:hypothetical protein